MSGWKPSQQHHGSKSADDRRKFLQEKARIGKLLDDLTLDPGLYDYTHRFSTKGMCEVLVSTLDQYLEAAQRSVGILRVESNRYIDAMNKTTYRVLLAKKEEILEEGHSQANANTWLAELSAETGAMAGKEHRELQSYRDIIHMEMEETSSEA